MRHGRHDTIDSLRRSVNNGALRISLIFSADFPLFTPRSGGIVMNMSRTLGLSLVAAALMTAYGCGKEEPKKAAEAPKAAAPAEEVVTVKIGHAGPLTGGIAHLGKDDENGVHLAVDEATAKKIKIGGKTVKFEMMSEADQADPKMVPTIAQT